ncbi:hypothetical protein CBS101457_001051 [Exobasidium rhododendri]|nr:hypothetical protein CBS101457_001051 [Exobasidium rhododendri]
MVGLNKSAILLALALAAGIASSTPVPQATSNGDSDTMRPSSIGLVLLLGPKAATTYESTVKPSAVAAADTISENGKSHPQQTVPHQPSPMAMYSSSSHQEFKMVYPPQKRENSDPPLSKRDVPRLVSRPPIERFTHQVNRAGRTIKKRVGRGTTLVREQSTKVVKYAKARKEKYKANRHYERAADRYQQRQYQPHGTYDTASGEYTDSYFP